MTMHNIKNLVIMTQIENSTSIIYYLFCLFNAIFIRTTITNSSYLLKNVSYLTWKVPSLGEFSHHVLFVSYFILYYYI